MGMADGNSHFAYTMFIFSLVLLMTMPMMVSVFVPSAMAEEEEDLLEDYYAFTGASKTYTKEAVWVLTGIYTPFEADGYGMTEDGWLYGERILGYTPTQYQSSPNKFQVKYEDGYYRYTDLGTGGSADYNADKGQGHKAGSLYTSVTFDTAHQSDIFFTEYGKYTRDGTRYVPGSNEPFYFNYTGWRYAFQPTGNVSINDAQGNEIKIVNTTTSLSLIWYKYFTQTGISGQLILTGSDGGTAYVTGDMIVKAFDSTTSTARFDLTFNQGVQIGLYIKIDPNVLSAGRMSIKDAYDYGYWSVMVTSLTTDSSAYTGTDNPLDIWKLLMTMVDLMTFNYSDYNMSPFMGAICSFVIIIPLYAGLIALALGSWPALAMVGILAALEGIIALMNNIGSWWPF